MKKFIYISSLILLLFSCKQNEIELYNQSTRINFLYGANEYVFNDRDYVDGVEYKELEIWVQLQGFLLDSPKDFVFSVSDSKDGRKRAEIVTESKYTYNSLDTNSQFVLVKLKRPEKPITEAQRAILRFDLSNPAHQFEPGRVDMDSCRVSVGFKLLESQYDWDTWTWGDYSDAKYLFMMDVCHDTHDNLTYEHCEEVKKAYAEYKAAHGPILDSNGDEIVFPD